MKTHIKPYGYGAYTPEKVEAIMSNGCLQQRGDGFYQPAKPIPYYSFFERVVQAWHVLTYQADPLYWHFKNPYERTSNGFRKINHSELDQDKV